MDLASLTRSRSQRAVTAEQRIPAHDVLLDATLTVPLGARGVVLLPYASSAGRFDRRHRFAAEVLEQAGLGTLQIDLLTPAEEAMFANGSQGADQVALLAQRIAVGIVWLGKQADTSQLAVGVFASKRETPAAVAAAARSVGVSALVSNGGGLDPTTVATAPPAIPTLLLLGVEELARAEELAAEFFGQHLI